jgi:hypothetical protein
MSREKSEEFDEEVLGWLELEIRILQFKLG